MSEFIISLSVDSTEDDTMTECGSTIEEVKEKMSTRILKKERVTVDEIEFLRTICSSFLIDDDTLQIERFSLPGTDNIRVLRQIPIKFRLPNYGDSYEVWKSYILFSDTQESDEFYYFEKVS